MTNEEIIRRTRYLAKTYEDKTVLPFEVNFHAVFADITNHIEEQAKENTKLKTEIEQLKSTISKMETTTEHEDDLK